MKKSDLLASLKSRLPELRNSDESGLCGGFSVYGTAGVNADKNGNDVCQGTNSCSNNTTCNDNGACSSNGLCEKNSKCSTNITCRNNEKGCKGNDNCSYDNTQPSRNIGTELLAYGSML